MRVLIAPAGTEIGLEAHASLAGSKHWQVVGANSVRDHAELVFDEIDNTLPMADAPGFVDAIRALIEARGIDIVVPAHDEAAYRLAGADLGRAIWAGPDPATAEILRFKSKTYQALGDLVPCPAVHDPQSITPQMLPLFARPDRGQGSRGAMKISTPAELELARSSTEAPLFTDLLPGEEFTIDAYTDRTGALRYLAARRRARIRGGITVRAEEADAALFRAHAEAINRRLKLGGPWFFQMKLAPDGQPKLLEVANRVSGAMGLQRERGINLLEAWLHELCGRDVELMPWSFGEVAYDRALAARMSWDYPLRSVYLDLDDTLVLPDGRLNHPLVGVLYGLKANRGARIVLVTRHGREVDQTLAGLGLTALFDQVCHLRAGEPKSASIEPDGAVFIDDSFAERREVWRRWKIPTFPVEALALLEGLAARRPS